MPISSREIRLASRPQGEPTLDNFAFATVELPDPKPGEVIVQNVCISVDPYMRGRMNDTQSYVPPFEIDKPLQGGAVGRVMTSNDPSLPVGTYVLSMFGWREAYVAPASQLQIVDVSLAPPSAYIGILGVTGMTAWLGLFRIGKLQDGETVFVSGGAGAVGIAACQFAKMHGCRVIASAGTDEKVAFLQDELKVDFAFNYRDGEPLGHLKKGAPEGLTCTSTTPRDRSWRRRSIACETTARIAMCGGIAGYNTPVPGPRNMALAISKRLRLEGFLILDWMKETPGVSC